jgi:hypothetical protein
MTSGTFSSQFDGGRRIGPTGLLRILCGRFYKDAGPSGPLSRPRGLSPTPRTSRIFATRSGADAPGFMLTSAPRTETRGATPKLR